MSVQIDPCPKCKHLWGSFFAGSGTLCDGCGAPATDTIITLRAQNAALVAAMETLRERYDIPGHAECKDPKNCPWSETHEELAIITAALAGAGKDNHGGNPGPEPGGRSTAGQVASGETGRGPSTAMAEQGPRGKIPEPPTNPDRGGEEHHTCPEVRRILSALTEEDPRIIQRVTERAVALRKQEHPGGGRGA